MKRPGLRVVAGLVAGLTAWAVSGCGGRPLATVRGTVTLDGKPVAGGTVLYEGAGRIFSGAIAPDGRYELRDRGRPAVEPGTYAITVMPPEPRYVVDARTTDLRPLGGDAERTHPARYRSAGTSGFVRDVPAGESTIDLPLTSR